MSCCARVVTLRFELQIHVLVVLRVLRLARVLRLLKLAHFSRSASQLLRVLTRSWRKVAVFLAAFTSLTVVVGAVMYTIEGADSGFTSIPQVRAVSCDAQPCC